MHPGFIHWWKSHRTHGCGPHACSPDHFGGAHAHFGWHEHGHGHGDAGAGFGVRRPLRYLAWKLELEEEQVGKLATVIETLKTERAQADVDFRRSTSVIAAALEGQTLDQAALDDAAKQRVASEERRQRAVATALASIHALLDDEQKKRFAYLVRTGAIQL
jgi:Spy/CpxP family protein refolding chaperone